MKNNLKVGAIFSYILSFIFIIMGFYKMFVYENPESILLDPKNVYVGGDAYNFIINANYATAYFTLAIFCAVIGISFIIYGFLTEKKETTEEITIHENNAVNSVVD